MAKFHLLRTTEDVEPGGVATSCLDEIFNPCSGGSDVDSDADVDEDALVKRWASLRFGRPQYHSVRTVDPGLAHVFPPQRDWERLRKPASVSVGLVLVAGVVFNLLVHLHVGVGTRVSRQVASPGDVVVESMSMDGAFDCAAGYADWEERWSSSKRAWCCEHELIACPRVAKAEAGPAKRTLTTMSFSYLLHGQDGHETCDGSGAAWGQWGRQNLAESLEACQQLCSETSECKHVQWQADRKVCHLYRTCSRKRRCDLHGYKCGLTFAKSYGTEGNASTDGSAECGSCTGSSCTTCSCTCSGTMDHVPPVDLPEEPFACSMTCDLNCYQGTGAEDVAFTQDVTAMEVDLGACRDACEATPGCDGIVWAKDNSHCSGRKNIHLAQCQPGDKYVTEICRKKPMGQCAILGDPHIRQFDNIYGNFVNDYDAGDFALVRSSVINVHARFGFTKQFPEATSLVGLAVGGAALEEHLLVVLHTGQGNWQDGFAVYWDGGQILGGYPSEFDSDKLKGRFAAMDPSDYHREARDTIGDSVESFGKSLPSYHFEFTGVDLSIYCLLGPDSMNAIVEMRKLSVEMDGLCGNFDCKPENDVKAKLRERGLVDPLTASESLFSTAGIRSPLVQISTDHSATILARCQTEHPELYQLAQTKCAISKDQAGEDVCIVDVCEGGNVNIGSLDTATEMVENEIEADIDVGEDPSKSMVATSDLTRDTGLRQTADIGVPVPPSCHCTCKICSCNTCEAMGKKAFCSSYACPAGHVRRRAAGRIECASDVCTSDDTDVCCNKLDTCDSLTCLPGQVHVDGAEHIRCAGQTCKHVVDGSRCCVSPQAEASCATMTCPEGYGLKRDAERMMCGASKCNTVNGSQDVQLCCEELFADCSTLACPTGMVLKDHAKAISCHGKQCSVEVDAEVCCDATVAEEPFDCTMTCDLDCSERDGANPDLDVGKAAGGPISEEDCREACEHSPSCQGIVWNRETQRCSAKKDVELSKCQPGKGEFITNVCRKLPLGKCALVGDPHIRQFDNLFGKYISIYDAGDYVMINSSDFLLHARFGFTEEFPDATSTTGVAMWGPLIKGNSLAVVYLGPIGWRRGFKAYWNEEPILEEFPSSYNSSDGFLKAQWGKMDPEYYHEDARHTIGDTQGTEGKDLPSFYFEFEDLDLNLYCLLGPDSMNCVIQMRKLKAKMDGLCGNFNCDADDDSKKSLKKRGFWEPVRPAASVFRRAGLPDAAVQSSKTDSEEVLGQCKEEAEFYEAAERNCDRGGTDEEDIRVCMVDACLARNVNAARADVPAEVASH